jgi:hypothetical protein
MNGRIVFVVLLAAIPLGGCGDVRRAMGYDKAPPDEFAVVARAPLSQPPDFTLRPPMPGAPRPQEATVRDQAKSLLVGGAAPTSAAAASASGRLGGLSQGERSLLAKAGADRVEPDIRRKVNQETTSLIEEDRSFSDKILFWRDKPPSDEVLDPAKEAKRLQENTSLGKPVSDSQSPQINRREKGWLDGIF